MRLGSHLSIGGGLHNAPLAAKRLGFGVLGMFVRNHVQWRAPTLSDEAVRRFRQARTTGRIEEIVAHGSYLVNLAGVDEIREKSIDAVTEDLRRCDRLGIESLVIHPGSCPDETEGIARIADGVRRAFGAAGTARTRLLLETTAGMGNTLGWRLEHLAEMLAAVGASPPVGVCLDTCHMFAAGYDFRSAGAYARTMAQVREVIGLGRVGAIHVNDSKRPLGSRVDRHEHIGKGRIGRRGFWRLVNDPDLAPLPLILETPKGTNGRGQDLDARNAAVLRRLVGRTTCPR